MPVNTLVKHILVMWSSELTDLGLDAENYLDFDKVLEAVDKSGGYQDLNVLTGTFDQCNHKALMYVASEDFKNVNEAFEYLKGGAPMAWATLANEGDSEVEQYLVFFVKED